LKKRKTDEERTMFRRREEEAESLFANDFKEENETVVVQPVVTSISAVNSAANTGSSSVQPMTPITRPVAVPVPPSSSSMSASNNFRPGAPAAAPAQNTPPAYASRPSEVKPMTPISSPNTAQSSVKPSHRVLTVGNDILLKGEIATCDRLVIEGKVEATLNEVHTVELAECGSFKGSANVVEAQISGLFEGDLVVTGRLVIYASGKVRGNVTYGEIEIERGGELTGQIKMTGGATAAQNTPKALRKEAA